MTKLKLLFAQRTKKFDEICVLVARELGYGKFPSLKREDRREVEAEAREYIKLWEETVEMRTSPFIRPMTPLRRLLNEHHNICERLLDEQEIEEGLWAYKARPALRRRPPAPF